MENTQVHLPFQNISMLTSSMLESPDLEAHLDHSDDNHEEENCDIQTKAKKKKVLFFPSLSSNNTN